MSHRKQVTFFRVAANIAAAVALVMWVIGLFGEVDWERVLVFLAGGLYFELRAEVASIRAHLEADE